MPACVAFDPGSAVASPLPHCDFDAPLLAAAKFDPALYSAQFKLQTTLQQHQQQVLLTPSLDSAAAAAGTSPFDDVPYEILDQILGLVHADNSRGIYSILRDLSACSLVSTRFNDVATNWLYRHVPISDPYAFTKVPCPCHQHVHSSNCSFLRRFPVIQGRGFSSRPWTSVPSPSSSLDVAPMTTSKSGWSAPRPWKRVSD
jgi:F-box-like